MPQGALLLEFLMCSADLFSYICANNTMLNFLILEYDLISGVLLYHCFETVIKF